MRNFYLHLHSYSSLAKTWLFIRHRISPWLKLFHITLYLCSEWSFVFIFLNRLPANEKASISKAVLEIELHWLRAQATQAGHVGDLILVCCGGLAAIKWNSFEARQTSFLHAFVSTLILWPCATFNSILIIFELSDQQKHIALIY